MLFVLAKERAKLEGTHFINKHYGRFASVLLEVAESYVCLNCRSDSTVVEAVYTQTLRT